MQEFKVWQVWKCRNGAKAKIVEIRDSALTRYPVGVVVDGASEVEYLALLGSYMKDREHPLDLVEFICEDEIANSACTVKMSMSQDGMNWTPVGAVREISFSEPPDACSEADVYFSEEAALLKIKVGQVWKCRGGSRATITGIGAGVWGPCTVTAKLEDAPYPLHYTAEGALYRGATQLRDLVEMIQEPQPTGSGYSSIRLIDHGQAARDEVETIRLNVEGPTETKFMIFKGGRTIKMNGSDLKLPEGMHAIGEPAWASAIKGVADFAAGGWVPPGQTDLPGNFVPVVDEAGSLRHLEECSLASAGATSASAAKARAHENFTAIKGRILREDPDLAKAFWQFGDPIYEVKHGTGRTSSEAQSQMEFYRQAFGRPSEKDASKAEPSRAEKNSFLFNHYGARSLQADMGRPDFTDPCWDLHTPYVVHSRRTTFQLDGYNVTESFHVDPQMWDSVSQIYHKAALELCLNFQIDAPTFGTIAVKVSGTAAKIKQFRHMLTIRGMKANLKKMITGADEEIERSRHALGLGAARQIDKTKTFRLSEDQIRRYESLTHKAVAPEPIHAARILRQAGNLPRQPDYHALAKQAGLTDLLITGDEIYSTGTVSQLKEYQRLLSLPTDAAPVCSTTDDWKDEDNEPDTEPYLVEFQLPDDGSGFSLRESVTVQGYDFSSAVRNARIEHERFSYSSGATVLKATPSSAVKPRNDGPGLASDLSMGDGLGPDGKVRP